MQSGIRLESVRGDETLRNMRFVCHGTTNAADGAAILGTGFRYIEGRPTVSSNLVHAADWTRDEAKQRQSLGNGPVPGEAGVLVVLAVPVDVQIGYGMFTDAIIDRTLKQVIGAPLRYAAARKQLAFYALGDWETRRREVERAVVAQDMSLLHTKSLPLSANLGVLTVEGEVASVIDELGTAAFELTNFDLRHATEYLVSEMQLYQQALPQLLIQAADALVKGTVESVIMSRLRMLRWQGLAGQGYRFREGAQEIQSIAPRQRDKQLDVIQRYGQAIEACPMLVNELAWLKPYAHRALDIMKVESADIA